MQRNPSNVAQKSPKPQHLIYTAQKNTPIKRDPAAADTAPGAVNEPAPPEYTGSADVSVGLAVDVTSVADVVEVAVVGAGTESSQFYNHSGIPLNHDNGSMRM